MTPKGRLRSIYKKLFKAFGPQEWWPAETPFEVAVGAILTQSTNWKNVEKAIGILKAHYLLSPEKLHRLSKSRLAQLIRPAGYYRVKSARLKNFLGFLFARYRGSMQAMRRQPPGNVRTQLLEVKGIGPETADSMLLYALGKPVFVVDAYTRRLLCRHGFAGPRDSYAQLQELFVASLGENVALFNEYHALIVRLGKEYCLKRAPRCRECPLFSDKKYGQ